VKKKIEIRRRQVVGYGMAAIGVLLGLGGEMAMSGYDLVLQDDEGSLAGFNYAVLGITVVGALICIGLVGSGLVIAGRLEVSRELFRVPWWIWPVFIVRNVSLEMLNLAFGLTVKKWMYWAGLIGFLFLMGYTSTITRDPDMESVWWTALDTLGEQLANGPMSGIIMGLFFLAIFGSMLREAIRTWLSWIHKLGLGGIMVFSFLRDRRGTK